MTAFDPLQAFAGGPALQALSLSVTPGEEHRVYGAVFLFLGTLALAEALAGAVWHRVRWRRLVQPASLMLMGTFVIVVNAMQVTPNPLHIVLGTLLLAGGALEWDATLRRARSTWADGAVIAILVLGAIVLGPMHHAPSFQRADVIHWLSAGVLLALAGVRLLRHYRPASATLATSFGLLFIVLGLLLLQMPDQHHSDEGPEAAVFTRTLIA